MPSLAELLTGSGVLTSPDAQVVRPAPTYVPTEALTRQYRLADMLRDQAPARSWAGVAAKALGAVGGNFIQGNADAAVAANQALRNQTLDSVRSAQDLPSLSKMLLSSQVPELQNAGVETRIKQMSRDPLDQEYKRAQIEALRHKGEVKEVNGRLVRVTPDGKVTEIYNAGPDTSKVPPGYRFSPDGQSLVPIPGGPGDKLSDVESKDALFAERMLRADKAIDEIVPMDKNGNLTGYDPTGVTQQLWPDESRFNSDDWKNLSQAKREFIAGILRKDTGAAVTEREFSDYDKIYFPQPGDSPQAMLQKKAARAAAAAGLRGASGRAFNRMFPNYDENGGPGAAAISNSTGKRAPESSSTSSLDRAIQKSDALARARKAIAEGAPRDAVIQRLQQNDIDPSGL